MQLAYVIKFVGDMGEATAFHRDRLSLTPGFESPFWTEFETGTTRLALHPATDRFPAGSCQLGFHVADLEAFYADREAAGVTFIEPPTLQHGTRLATFLDSDGAPCRISG
jgi:lactoylglutathione lyase